MANTFTLKTPSYGSGRYMQLDCSQKTDIANNKSTITWTLTSAGGTSLYFSTGPTTVKINGTQVYYIARKDYTTEVFPAKQGRVSGSIDIYHDDKGAKTITVELSTAIYVGAVSTYSGSWELDSIPRKAEITWFPESFTDQDNPTIYYNNPAGGAVSLMACISFTGDTDDISYRNVDPYNGEYVFWLTDEERAILRNNTTGYPPSRKVIFYLTTAIGGKHEYSTRESVFIVSDSDVTKPTVSINYGLNNSNLPPQFKDVCIQGKTRLDVTLGAQGKYNASISRLWANVETENYYYSPFTTNVLPWAGTRTLTAYATDSRGFTNSASKTVEVIPYTSPSVDTLSGQNAILCYRSDGNGKRIGNSTSVWVKAKRGFSRIQNNYCALQYRYKKSAESWVGKDVWTDLISRENSNDNYNALITGVAFELKESYTVQIRAIDDLGEYDIKTFDIPTMDVALHLGRGGKNVSVGSYCDYSEEYTFHSEWKAIFDNGIHGTVNNQKVDDVFDFASKCGQGFTPIYTNWNTANVPDQWENCSGYVQKLSDELITIFLTNHNFGTMAVNVRANGEWEGWKYLSFNY